MSLFYNFLCQNLSRYKLFIFFTKIVFKLSFFFINKHDKENYKLWLKYRNKKQKIFKGYLIYNCTLNPTWIGFHLQQIFFLQCFYLNGYVPIILNGRLLEKIYRNLNFITLDNIFKYLPKKINITSISRKISKLKFHQKKNFKWRNVNCGNYAKNSALRYLKVAKLNEASYYHNKIFDFYLKKSILITEAAFNLKAKYNLKYGFFNDHDMCGEGELFSLLVDKKHPQFSITAGYKNNSFYLKKFFNQNRHEHPRSCSKKTQHEMKKKKINNNKIKNLNQEIYKTYENNSWEVYAKTQVNTSFVSKQKFINELNLDINKKIVVLFSHIYFDATFSWGENIFNDYEDWLCMSIKSLLKNKNINIILKIHPANISKNFSDKKNKFKEINSLKKTLNKIPKNLKIILPDSKISTYSVIKFMDVCITVRGTVGIEAILQKKLVLTCGSGRYDRLGFTKDFANRSKYLKYLEKSNFETNKKINFKLGEKFAYYSMVKRPFFPKTTISKYILKKANFPNCFFSPKNLNDKKFKSDFKKLTDWIKNKDEDYLN